jgi:Tfp pilus assembly protein PilF
MSGNDNFSRLAGWFFADRTTRTISPFQSETAAEYVNRRIEENSRASLEEAVRLDPTNALALARLATIIRQTDSLPGSLADANNLARRAMRFDPHQRVAGEILTQPLP